MSKIMAVNAGSSSLKFQLFEMPEEGVIAKGLVERIGLGNAEYTIKYGDVKSSKVVDAKTHKEAVEIVLNDLIDRQIVSSLDEIVGVGHRIVQGGKYFSDSALVTEEVFKKIESLIPLAPLHNKAHLIGIEAFQNKLPQVPNVAVFDTSFHQTMEPDTYMYAIPYEWYEKYDIRKYGAHGTSHKYVSYRAAELIGKPVEELKIITCHIGNGASISAVKGGKCVDTSMGLTPLEGIPMGTRSGNIDPTVVEVVCRNTDLSVYDVVNALNKKSGYLGVSGCSNDSRDLESKSETDARCKLALEIQYKRIADYIGSYYVLMGGVDAIVFTAGIGENSPRNRAEVIKRVAVLGAKLDEEVNSKTRGKEMLISSNDSKVKVFVIPTEEELMIARDVVRLTTK